MPPEGRAIRPLRDLLKSTSRVEEPEKLRWVRQAGTPHAARWRLSNFLRYAESQVGGKPLLEAVRKALGTVEKHRERILERWTSTHSNARMEAMIGLFQAARARARGYRNTASSDYASFARSFHNQTSP